MHIGFNDNVDICLDVLISRDMPSKSHTIKYADIIRYGLLYLIHSVTGVRFDAISIQFV